jgi:hypothetical protein
MGENGLGAPTIGLESDTTTNMIPQIYLYNNLLVTKDGSVPWYLKESKFPDGGFKVGGNGLYNNTTNASAPMVNGMSLGIVADPKLNFENNPSVAPSITDIDNMPMQLSPFFLLNANRMAPPSLKNGGADLATAIRPDWWAPDDFWKQTLPRQPHDFFGFSLSGGSTIIGVGQSPVP